MRIAVYFPSVSICSTDSIHRLFCTPIFWCLSSTTTLYLSQALIVLFLPFYHDSSLKLPHLWENTARNCMRVDVFLSLWLIYIFFLSFSLFVVAGLRKSKIDTRGRPPDYKEMRQGAGRCPEAQRQKRTNTQNMKTQHRRPAGHRVPAPEEEDPRVSGVLGMCRNRGATRSTVHELYHTISCLHDSKATPISLRSGLGPPHPGGWSIQVLWESMSPSTQCQ